MTKPLIVRNSSRSKFKRCPRAYWWAYEDGLAPRRKSDALQFGTWVHEALADWYRPGLKRGPHPADTFERIADNDLHKIKLNDGEQEKFADLFALGVVLLEEYVKHWGTDPQWHIIKSEKTFKFFLHRTKESLGSAIQVGTVDGVYRDLDTGFIWLVEHKTAKSIGTTHLTLDEQPSTYLTVAERHLKKLGLLKEHERIHGIMYNFLRKAMPDDKPRDDEGYVLNKNGSRSKRQPKPLFERHPIHRTLKARKRFLNRLKHDAERMLALREEVQQHGEGHIMKTPHWSCARFCEFFAMCELEEEGGNWQSFRDSMYLKIDPFSDHRKSTDEQATFEFG